MLISLDKVCSDPAHVLSITRCNLVTWIAQLSVTPTPPALPVERKA
jgi:hypothetical protein